MKYYQLKDHVTIRDRWFLGEINFQHEFDFWKYTHSGKIPPPDVDELKIVISFDGKPLDFTFAAFDLMIVNEKTANLFSELEVQLFPVKILNFKSDTNYFLMTTTIGIDCFDYKNSVYELWEENNNIRPDKAGKIYSIQKLVIDTSKLDSVEIFRLTSYDLIIIVNENVRKKMIKQKITGIKFEEIITTE